MTLLERIAALRNVVLRSASREYNAAVRAAKFDVHRSLDELVVLYSEQSTVDSIVGSGHRFGLSGTDGLLWAIIHLRAEMQRRIDASHFPASDIAELLDGLDELLAMA